MTERDRQSTNESTNESTEQPDNPGPTRRGMGNTRGNASSRRRPEGDDILGGEPYREGADDGDAVEQNNPADTSPEPPTETPTETATETPAEPRHSQRSTNRKEQPSTDKENADNHTASGTPPVPAARTSSTTPNPNLEALLPEALAHPRSEDFEPIRISYKVSPTLAADVSEIQSLLHRVQGSSLSEVRAPLIIEAALNLYLQTLRAQTEDS